MPARGISRFRIKTPSDSCGPPVVVTMKDSEAAVKKFASYNIVVSNRMDGLRISFHLYNTADDVRSVLGVLRDNLDVAVRQ